MPQPKKGPRLGSNPAHQRLMLRNLARSLFEHERITTTEAKAKMLRPFAEKLITKAKKGDIHSRRIVLSHIEDRAVVHKLFAEIGPRFSERNGGYTRLLKLGPRNGDNAPMALVELVDEGVAVTVTDDDEAAARRRRGLRRPARKKTDEAAPAEAGDDSVTAAEEIEADEQGESPGDADSETSQGTPGDADPGSQGATDEEGEADDAVPAEAAAQADTGDEAEGSTGAGGAPGKQ